MVDRLNNSTGVLARSNTSRPPPSTWPLAEAPPVLRPQGDDRRATMSPPSIPPKSCEAQGGSLNAVTLSLSRAESISDTAIAAGEQVSKLLIEMQETVDRRDGRGSRAPNSARLR